MAAGEIMKYADVVALLQKYDVQMPEQHIVTTIEEALSFAQGKYPVVLKVLSEEIVHKSDAGVVALNITNDAMLREAYERIIANAGNAQREGVLVQRMASKGIELIVGSKDDPQFGPTILVGLGGIFVEVLKDFSLRIAPVDEEEALLMLDELKGRRILEGARGQPPIDKHAVARLISQVSQMVYDYYVPQLDLNPVIAYPTGYVAVDARIVGTDKVIKRRETDE